MSNALFPKKGIPWPELERVLDDARGRDIDWRAGRQIMTCYQVDDELRAVADAAYAKFLHENALLRGDMGGRGGGGFFPSLAKVDDESSRPGEFHPEALTEPCLNRNLSTTLRHRRFLFTDSFLLLWKWRVG